MTNLVQFEILKEGVDIWNKWRAQNPGVFIDLSGSDLYGANLGGINLNAANLERAFLEKADLGKADLLGANLSHANLVDANLFDANLAGANLRRANLFGANLMGANLSAANMTGATLANAVLARARIDQAKISGSWVYGVNVRGLEGEFGEQRDLIFTHKGQPTITVDNIKVAQLIYLILNNTEIRDAIDTFTSKTVLILGRFRPLERKAILDALKNGLREYNLLPIVFEFDRRMKKDFTDTIKTLASLSYFVIADITNPKSSPIELQGTLPDCQIPFVPIIKAGERPLSMMVELPAKYTWVLDRVSYDSAEALTKALKTEIIDPAIKKHNKLGFNEALEQKIRSAKDFLSKGEQ
jgi:uncharacterized protein YjbI with pentapeptide repeats